MNNEKDQHPSPPNQSVENVLAQFVTLPSLRYIYFSEKSNPMEKRHRFGLSKVAMAYLDELIDKSLDEDGVGNHHGIVMMARHLDSDEEATLIMEASVIGKEEKYQFKGPVGASLLNISDIESPREIDGDVISIDSFALDLEEGSLQIKMTTLDKVATDE